MKFSKALVILFISLTFACAEDNHGPNVVASYAGGTVDIQAIEQQLRLAGETIDQTDRGALLQAYRDVAERIVVEKTMLDRATPHRRRSRNSKIGSSRSHC